MRLVRNRERTSGLANRRQSRAGRYFAFLGKKTAVSQHTGRRHILPSSKPVSVKQLASKLLRTVVLERKQPPIRFEHDAIEYLKIVDMVLVVVFNAVAS